MKDIDNMNIQELEQYIRDGWDYLEKNDQDLLISMGFHAHLDKKPRVNDPN